MLILLSPAKTLDLESKIPTDTFTQPLFLEDAAYLVSKLKKMSPRKLKSLMDISENLAQLNAERFGTWSTPFTPDNARQSMFTFHGDVYLGLKAEKFSKAQINYAQNHLRILSGLYGLLRPLDLMQPYRLEMGTSWAVTSAKKNLYLYWRKKLTGHLKDEIKESGSEFLLNLASQEYAKAVDFTKMKVPVISPDFKEEKGGKFQMVSFFAKKARGMMARYAIEHKISKPADLLGFDTDGYGFNESLSNRDKNKWVFTRKST